MNKGWFATPGRPGDRTLAEQMKGLERLWPQVRDKRVLDVGCAEGLIAGECVRHGAMHVTGLEIVKEHVQVARRLHDPFDTAFMVLDLNDQLRLHDAMAGMLNCDIILMLAIAHKLQRPDLMLNAVLGRHSPELIVLRTPKETPGFVRDERSGFKLFDLTARLWDYGFRVEHECLGHFDENVRYFTKR